MWESVAVAVSGIVALLVTWLRYKFKDLEVERDFQTKRAEVYRKANKELKEQFLEEFNDKVDSMSDAELLDAARVLEADNA